MTAQPEYQQLHELVDQLTLQQARHLRAVAEDLVAVESAPPSVRAAARNASRQLSFVGVGESGLGDLAENADRYLADGFVRYSD